jgi:hypothetical protein
MKTKEQILTKDLRAELKTIMQKELKQLPELLKELDTKERLNVLCKLLPFILPRVEQIRHDNNEPTDWSL